MLKALFAVAWLLSVTCAVKLDVPAELGVPDIDPLDEFSEIPAGRLPLAIDQVYGAAPPVAARVSA